MEEVYPNYDVLLLTSKAEGTSISMLESMAHGLVPVVTNVSGSEDVILHGHNGFLYEIGDISLMVKLIVTLATNKELLRKMSYNAYHTIKNNYRIDSQLSKLQQHIDIAIQKPLISKETAFNVLKNRISCKLD